ncbi:MAG: hypothetical protein ACJ77C_09615 [Chloroflexota bacterium]
MTADDLDGVTAAPGNHKVIFENERVRVIRTTIPVGTLTPLHTHLTPTLQYVVSGSHFIRRDEGAAVMFDTRADPDYVLPQVQFAEAIPRHTIENTGDDDLIVIGVELKEASAG